MPPTELIALQCKTSAQSLTVADVAASIAFYRDVLGFALGETYEMEGKLMAAEMKAGAVSIVLGQDDWQQGRDRHKGVGFRLHCVTDQNIDALAAGIKARGGTFTHEPTDQPWGARDFGIVDPDGFKLSISSSDGGSDGSGDGNG